MKGIAVMLNELGGNDESATAFKGAIGKIVTALRLGENDNSLHFTFSDGTGIRLVDDGQSCCERRYMRTDDDLSGYIGGKLLSAEIREGPESESEYGDLHEMQFLVVKTSKGQFVISNHNEHNGYYGGFSIACFVEETAK